ncbi:MFS transporter [Ruania alba]|uniref:Predicted arabinose efflux permease, MFS family n=1 Tax=Ruania alba TaxID=648782 RepID=A0A1H5BMG8_9MICO|nr:MFS transporter [Ruania alba]SED55833.1 Predicted arabinose efflux permease, MFS family [Ruania alba]
MAHAPLAAPLGRRFWALFGATSFSNLADGVLMVATPLLALTLTTSPLLISLLPAATWLPWLLLGLYSGVLIDRGDRRRIFLIATAVRIAVLASLVGTAWAGALSMPALLVALLAFGCAEVFADGSASTMIPAVTPRSRLGAANSRLLGAQQVANGFLGAPLGGLLASIGAAWAFGVPGLLCVLTLITVAAGLRGPYRAQPVKSTDGAARPPAVRTEVRDGLTFLATHPVLRPILIGGAALNFANTGYFAVFVLWAVGPDSAIGLDPAQFGLISTAIAAGAVAGSVAAEALLRRFSEARLIGVNWLVNSTLLLFPVLLPNPWAVAASFVLIGATNTVGNVVSRSMRQRLVPDAMLGRIGGASATVAYGTMPLGAVLGGAVGEMAGLPSVFVGAAAICIAFSIYVLHTVTPPLVRAADEAALSHQPKENA